MRQVPWVGRIAAGTPILAEEAIEDIIPLPVDIVGTGPVFLLTVKGDSMVGAGILDGDLVVVRSQPDADDGEIVAAMVDGEEATVKRLRRRDGSDPLGVGEPGLPGHGVRRRGGGPGQGGRRASKGALSLSRAACPGRRFAPDR